MRGHHRAQGSRERAAAERIYLAEAQRLSHTGSFGWRVATGEIIWSEETFRIFGFDKAPSVRIDTVIQRIHPTIARAHNKPSTGASRDGKDFDHEYRLLMPDGSIKHVHATAHAVTDASGGIEFVGAVTDVTARKRAEEKLHEAQAELAHVTRVTALGELAASIAHEVNQPLAAVVANAAACQRWLDRDPPDLQGSAQHGAVDRRGRQPGGRNRVPRRADRRARPRRVHEPVDQPELGQQRRHFGPPREERLGADVVGPAREVDGAQHAADAVALLQHRDRGFGAEQGAQAVGSGQTRDPRPDHGDAGVIRPRCAPARPAG